LRLTINIAFGLIYNEEYKEIGSQKNPYVAVPADFCPGKQHAIYLSPAVTKILSQVDELKAENPDLKILLSVGGWGARGFSDAAAKPPFFLTSPLVFATVLLFRYFPPTLDYRTPGMLTPRSALP